jgi:NAD(P)-dependent dehydrogenase (short-subunit alcohol dehydrogenase family)
MSQKLAGKVAMITGAASGIGRATAVLFASEGASVVVADLNQNGSAETVRLIEEAGGTALALPLDVTNAAQTQQVVQTAVERFGRFDILFNNAGVGRPPASIINHTEEDWDFIVDINLKGVWLGIKYGADAMIKAGNGGSIINTSSMAGLVGFTNNVAYSASKTGVIGITKTAALELARYKIRVNALAPAYTYTPMVQELFDSYADPERVRQRMTTNIPLGRLGEADDIARAALYFASDDSGFTTGVTLPLDGGLSAM